LLLIRDKKVPLKKNAIKAVAIGGPPNPYAAVPITKAAKAPDGDNARQRSDGNTMMSATIAPIAIRQTIG
jgi:hypothetical protein